MAIGDVLEEYAVLTDNSTDITSQTDLRVYLGNEAGCLLAVIDWNLTENKAVHQVLQNLLLLKMLQTLAFIVLAVRIRRGVLEFKFIIFVL